MVLRDFNPHLDETDDIEAQQTDSQPPPALNDPSVGDGINLNVEAGDDEFSGESEGTSEFSESSSESSSDSSSSSSSETDSSEDEQYERGRTKKRGNKSKKRGRKSKVDEDRCLKLMRDNPELVKMMDKIAKSKETKKTGKKTKKKESTSKKAFSYQITL